MNFLLVSILLTGASVAAHPGGQGQAQPPGGSQTRSADQPNPGEPQSPPAAPASADPAGPVQTPTPPGTPQNGGLVPSDPAVPILSEGVYAAPSTQPGRAYERPYRGLFRGGAVGPDQPGLFLTLGTFAAQDSNVLAAAAGRVRTQPGVRAGGYYAGASSTLAYLRTGDRLSVTAGGGTGWRYYDQLNDWNGSYSGSASVGFTLGARNRVTLSQGVSLAPLYRFSSLPGLSLPADARAADADYGGVQGDRLASSSLIAFRRELGGRSDLTLDFADRRADFDGTQFDLRVRRMGGAYARRVGRYGGLQLGYHYREGLYGSYGNDGTSQRTRMHDIDIGGGYARPLSFSRRTTISVGSGSSVISRDLADNASVRYYRLSGSFGVQHEMGRTWTLLGNYNRGMQFIEGFTDPFFVDGAQLSAEGLIGPRFEVDLALSYAEGGLRATTQSNPYESYSGNVRLGYALTRSLQLSSGYGYYTYNFRGTAGLPVVLSPNAGRHSIRIGLSYWLPLITSR